MAFQPVGDSIALARFAYDLYSKGIEIIRHAPDEFRQLLHELDIIRKILWTIQTGVGTGIDEDGFTKDILRLCKSALSDFKPLLDRYENLASTDRGHWIRRVQWAADQAALKRCRDKLKNYQDLLQLALHPSLREGRTNPLEIPSTQSSSGNLPVSPANSSTFERQGAGSSLNSGLSVTSAPPELSPPLGDRAEASLRRAQAASSVGPELPTAEQLGIVGLGFEWPWDLSSSSSDPVFPSYNSPEGVPAFRHSVPLHPGRQKYPISPTLHSEFRRRHEQASAVADLGATLRHATWWFLKSQAVFATLANSSAGTYLPTSPMRETSWENTVSAAQACTDLAKSSWMIEDLIIRRDPMGEQLDDVFWSNLKDLSDSISQHLNRRRESFPNLTAFVESQLQELDINLIEPFVQPIEEPQQLPKALDSLSSPWRWITTHIENAGDGLEHVIFRTFINAQLGERAIRRRTGSAPYMLLLWCQEGHSELIISLCNQHGTVSLCRNLTVEDLADFEESGRPEDEIEINFPSQPAIIKFLSKYERAAFLGYPQRFFADMSERSPKSEEFLVFREKLKLKLYKIPGPDASSATRRSVCGPRKTYEISLYESMVDECWRTTRRLVISSDPSAPRPWCSSLWLPLSGILVLVERREITLSWSDFNHLETKTDGSWGKRYFYEYDQDRANCSITVEFEESKSAQNFADRLLRPFETPFVILYLNSKAIFESSSGQQVQVYEVLDPKDGGKKGYHAIVSVERKQNLRCVSEIFFAYRDFDFALETSQPSIVFPSLRVPHYISDQTDLISPLDQKGGGANFSEAVLAFRPARLAFDSRENMALFMQHLVGWQLKFCRQVRAVHEGKARLSKNHNHKDATVHVWERQAGSHGSHALRLSVRSEQANRPKWTTALLSDSHHTTDSPASFKVVLKGLKIEKGTEIDSKKMTATDLASLEQERPDQRWTMTIIFKETRDSSRFMNVQAAAHASDDEAVF